MGRPIGRHDYDKGIRERAIRMYFEEGKASWEIRKELGIENEGRVTNWIWKYKKEGPGSLTKQRGRPRKQAESERSYIKRLEMENDLLRNFHIELRRCTAEKRSIG
jgi:transposase-like protein